MTRFLCASHLAVSLPILLQVMSPYRVVWIWRYVANNYEVGMVYPFVRCKLIFTQVVKAVEAPYKFLCRA